MNWTPTTLSELQRIVREELQECSNEERIAYVAIKTEFEKVPIVRCEKLESVFRVAMYSEWLLIFEDIEQGFEWCKPDSDGVIREYGCGQGGLQAALRDYVERTQD